MFSTPVDTNELGHTKTSSAAPARRPDLSENQRTFVYGAAARSIDEIGRRLHLRNFSSADEVLRFLAQRHVDAHDVAFRKQRGQFTNSTPGGTELALT